MKYGWANLKIKWTKVREGSIWVIGIPTLVMRNKIRFSVLEKLVEEEEDEDGLEMPGKMQDS